jgi:hypothetical protein
MKKSLFALTVALASCLVSSRAQAQNYLPMEVVVGEADCIVLGEVTAVSKPIEMELDGPDFPTPHKGWYHTFKVKVTRQILPIPPAADKSVKKQIIEAMTMCADPNAKPADPPVRGSYQNAVVGNSYLLILNKLPGHAEYYLPAYSMNFRPDTDAGVKEVEKLAAAGIESWSWGKPFNGLQVGLYLFAHTNIGGGPNSSMEACVVLRNTTDKPLAVNFYEDDRCLEITATSTDGKVFDSGFYSWRRHIPMPFDPAVNSVVIGPRGKVFVGSRGRATTIKWNMPLGPGKYVFQVSYTSKREGNGKNNLKLWLGTIESKPSTVTINSKPG